MNRRGFIPTLLIFIVALGLAILALTVFISSGLAFSSGTEQFNNLVLGIEFSEDYVVRNSEVLGSEAIMSGLGIRGEFMVLVADKDISNDDFGNFFGKIRNGEFVFEKVGDNYFLEFEKLFVRSVEGQSSIIRNFNLMIEFDGNGTLLDKEINYIS